MSNRQTCLSICIGLIVACWFGSLTCAQIPGQHMLLTPPVRAQESSSRQSDEETRSKRSAVNARLASVVKEIKRKQDPETPSQVDSSLDREANLLKQIDSILAQQQSAASNKKQLESELEQLKSQLSDLRINGLKMEKPYSFLIFDQFKNQLDAAKEKLESVKTTVSTSNEMVQTAKKSKESKEAANRLNKDNLANNRDDSKTGELEATIKISELEARLAAEALTLRRQLYENDQLTEEIARISVDFLSEQVRLMESGMTFSEADLQEVLVELDKKTLEGENAVPEAESKLKIADKELNSFLERVGETPEKPIEQEELKARRLERQYRQREVDFQVDRLARLSKKRELWNRRYKVINEQATNSELSEWVAEARNSSAASERERTVQTTLADDLRKELTALDARLQTTDDETSGIEPWLIRQQEALQQLLLVNDRNLAGINSLLELQNDFLANIEGDIANWTIAERLQGLWEFVVQAWNTELTVIDELPITLGKVIIGLICLIAGFFVARMLSRLLSNRLLQRFGLDEGAAAAIKSLSFYVFISLFTLLALRIANVPLTIFTLLGGALAIGVGFGSQAIINNFISGLIILAERPIQVGDLVKLDELVGNVTHIGTRSTRIRTGDNLDIIVPNSKFLESNVLNYTLGDDRFRSHIKVGLAYGSPTREASKLLIKAAEEHGLVLKNPKPFVWFRNFGSDSLEFELHVWIKVRTLGERIRIESDVRYRIDQLFREAGIVIAFPQRDVHLDTSRPLELRMLPAADSLMNSELSGSSGRSDAA